MNSPGRRAWFFIAAAAGLAGASLAAGQVWLPGAIAGGVGAGAALVAGAWVTRATTVLQARDAERRALDGQLWRGRAGRLPLVDELHDPVALGVHPAAALGSSPQNRFAPFVVRQHGSGLADVLLRDHFVLLVGESTAGKSRAAYELMRAQLPGHRVVQPASRDAAQAAAACAAATPGSALWLDDLERFLGSGGLTGPAIRTVLEARGSPRFIIATMRSEEYAKFSGRAASGLEGMDTDALRQGRDVLSLATRIDVPRMWSPEEIGRARQLPEDPRLAEAVRHAGSYGIAEYLAAAPQLLAEWRDAWAPGTHPRAAAMIMAAVDARRAGVHRPLPLTTLADLHQPYLARRGGDRLRPETVESAVAWATAPLYATSSLLVPSGGGYLAFDYLIDAVDQDRMPAETLDALIQIAAPGEALDIGQLAWSWSLTGQAETAFQRAEAGGLFEATARRCFLIGESRGGNAVALRFAREAVEWTTAVLGPDHPQTLEAWQLVAWQTRHNGDAATALHFFRNLASRSRGMLGADHEQTLSIRAAVAAMTGDEGDPASAARQYQELAADCCRVLGDDHQQTITCQDQAAVWTSEAGDPARAVRMLSVLLSDMTQRFRSASSDVLHARRQLARSLTQVGEYVSALREWELLVTETTTTYGRLRSNTIYVREQLAWCAGESGDAARAVQLLEDLLADITGLGDRQLLHLLFVRRSLAWWVGEAGNPSGAVRRLSLLADETSDQRGASDRGVATLRLMLAHWVLIDAKSDDLSDLESNAELIGKHLGPAHEVTRASLRAVARRQAEITE
jgi:hypothetical protein